MDTHAMDTQELLQAAALDRFQRLAGMPGAGSVAVPEVCVAVVVRTLDPETFLRGTVEFASAVPDELRDPWYRAYTKTLFLAGDPRHLPERFGGEHVAGDGAIALYGQVT